MILIQVVKRRPSGLVTAQEVREDGSIQPRKNTLVIRFEKASRPAVLPGSVWKVSGQTESVTFTRNNIPITEERLSVERSEFVRPSGELLARWIAANVEGVGDVKARRLVRGIKNLNQAVKNHDVALISSVAGWSVDAANKLIAQWPSEEMHSALVWLQESQLPLGIADRLARVYGDTAIDRIKADPYILSAFDIGFDAIQSFIQRAGIKVSREKTMAAVVERVMTAYRHKTQSTVMPAAELMGSDTIIGLAKSLVVDPAVVVDEAVKAGVIVMVSGGFQLLGTAIQEASVARFINKCVDRPAGTGCLLASWEKDLTDEKIEAALQGFESTLTFQMSAEQRASVAGAVKSPVSVISGGAGTGKTTILLAILSVYEALQSGLATYQVALSGRAAQRMAESTNREAVTIAKLLADHVGDGKSKLPEHLLLVIDEASMVDLLSMYKLVGILPYATRIIFVGDASQLPPVGAGLVFHSLMTSGLPAFNLTQVKRQGEDSGIHILATAIRNQSGYSTSLLDSASGDVRYVPTDDAPTVLAEYQGNDPAETIILTPTRRGNLGVEALNRLIQSTFDADAPNELRYFDEERGFIPWITKSGDKLRLGDRLMVSANDYDADIRNGDLGELIEVFEEPDGAVFGIAEINGEKVEVTASVIEKLELGYAITIHKSQGSQWSTCILVTPSYATAMVDQTLMYTAITRASETLIVIGDSGLIETSETRFACFESRYQSRCSTSSLQLRN